MRLRIVKRQHLVVKEYEIKETFVVQCCYRWFPWYWDDVQSPARGYPTEHEARKACEVIFSEDIVVKEYSTATTEENRHE